eukprot:357053-Chlamydomonas_euryale.AAC.1
MGTTTTRWTCGASAACSSRWCRCSRSSLAPTSSTRWADEGGQKCGGGQGRGRGDPKDPQRARHTAARAAGQDEEALTAHGLQLPIQGRHRHPEAHPARAARLCRPRVQAACLQSGRPALGSAGVESVCVGGGVEVERGWLHQYLALLPSGAPVPCPLTIRCTSTLPSYYQVHQYLTLLPSGAPVPYPLTIKCF